MGRGNDNQPPKEKGGKACHLLFLFVFDIFLWSVGKDRTKASLEESLSHILLYYPQFPPSQGKGMYRQHGRMPTAQVKWSISKYFCSPVDPCFLASAKRSQDAG